MNGDTQGGAVPTMRSHTAQSVPPSDWFTVGRRLSRLEALADAVEEMLGEMLAPDPGEDG